MAKDPAFTRRPNMGLTLSASRISTANTNRDGTGTIATILTAGQDGTRVDRVQWKATGATTAGVVRLYVVDAAATIRLLAEALVTAITPSATIKSAEGEFVRTDGQPLVMLEPGMILKASTHNAESFDVLPVVAGDF